MSQQEPNMGDLMGIAPPVPYSQQMQERRAEQAGMSRGEIMSDLAANSEAVFDPDNLPEVKHNWIDRGLKMSCEGAGHPMHQSWKQGGHK